MTTLNKRAVAQVLAAKPDNYVRQLLELRRTDARAAVTKFKRMLAYASPADDRMRGTLRMYGGAPGRWSGLGPQLQNLKKNESSLPLSVVDSVRDGDRRGIAQYGNPLALLGDILRAALCASEGMELKAGDFSAIESVVLAWLARESPASSRSFSSCQIGLTMFATGRSGFGKAIAGVPRSARKSCEKTDVMNAAAKTAATVIRSTPST
jgi:hypothetical protein